MNLIETMIRENIARHAASISAETAVALVTHAAEHLPVPILQEVQRIVGAAIERRQTERRLTNGTS